MFKYLPLILLAALSACSDNHPPAPRYEQPAAIQQPLAPAQPVIVQSAPASPISDMLLGGVIGHMMANQNQPTVIDRRPIIVHKTITQQTVPAPPASKLPAIRPATTFKRTPARMGLSARTMKR